MHRLLAWGLVRLVFTDSDFADSCCFGPRSSPNHASTACLYHLAMDIDRPPAADGAPGEASTSTATPPAAASPHAPNHLLTSATNPSLEQVESHFKPAQSSPSAWLDSLGSKAEQGSWSEVKNAFQKK